MGLTGSRLKLKPSFGKRSQEHTRTKESTNSTVRQEPYLQEQCSDDTTTLQDLPLEILDMILLKAVLYEIHDWKKPGPCPTVDVIQKPLELLMTVCCVWYCRMNTRWFKIKLWRRKGSLVPFLWKTINLDRVVAGFTKIRNRIYVLCNKPISIYVYEDNGDFCLINKISLTKKIPFAFNIHASQEGDGLYVLEAPNKNANFAKTIWKMDGEGTHVAKWLEDNRYELLLSVAKDGNVMVMKQPKKCTPHIYDKYAVRIGIYRPDATLLNRFRIPHHIFANIVVFPYGSLAPLVKIINGVQTQKGNFVISYEHQRRKNYTEVTNEISVIVINKKGKVKTTMEIPHPEPSSLLSADGFRVTKTTKKYCFWGPIFISLNMPKEGKLLFVNDITHRFIGLYVLRSNSLRWLMPFTFPTKASKGSSVDNPDPPYPSDLDKVRPFPVYVDSKKMQILVRHCNTNDVAVYRIA